MDYEIRTITDAVTGSLVPLTNDRDQVQVRMTVDGKILDQDFDIENLDENVKQGMAIFKAELAKAPTQIDTSPLNALIGQKQKVLAKDLPVIPPEDFEPEPAPVGELPLLP